MSELCLSNTAKTKFSSLLISVFIFLSSFVLSHPLHFLFLIIFSPFLLKTLSFLSPLFITTSLLLIAFLTISPGLVKDNFSTEKSSKRKVSMVRFLLTAYHAVLQKLQPKKDFEYEDSFHSMEALEVYKTVFETSMTDETVKEIDGLEENPEEKILQAVESSVMKIPRHHDEALTCSWVENSDQNDKVESIKSVILQEKMSEDFLDGFDEFESVNCSVKKMEAEPRRRQNLQSRPSGTKVDKVVDKHKEKSLVKNGSEATAGNKICDATVMVGDDVENRREYASKVKAHSEKLSAKTHGGEYASRDGSFRSMEYDLGSYGSMRKEKSGEYTSRDGSSRSMEYDLKSYGSMRKEKSREYTSRDGNNSRSLDLGSYGSMRKGKEWKRTLACKLFEERHNNVEGGEGMDLLWETYEMESSKANTKKKNSKSKGKMEYFLDEGDEAEDEVDGQLCCLQAFNFSAGKMNMGVGRRNLVRLSKAVKGFGWLHHVTRQRKKVHNGDTFQFA